MLPLLEQDLKSTIFNLIDLVFNSRTSGVSSMLDVENRIQNIFMLVSFFCLSHFYEIGGKSEKNYTIYSGEITFLFLFQAKIDGRVN